MRQAAEPATGVGSAGGQVAGHVGEVPGRDPRQGAPVLSTGRLRHGSAGLRTVGPSRRLLIPSGCVCAALQRIAPLTHIRAVGKPEPAWLDERGKYINVVYTRALEHRFKYTPQQPQQQLQQEEGQRQQGEAAAGQQGDAEVDVESEAAAVAPMDVLLRKLGRWGRE